MWKNFLQRNVENLLPHCSVLEIIKSCFQLDGQTSQLVFHEIENRKEGGRLSWMKQKNCSPLFPCAKPETRLWWPNKRKKEMLKKSWGWIRARVAGVGWLSATAKYSLVFVNFRDKKNFFFYHWGETGICGCQGTITKPGCLLLKALQKQDQYDFRWKLYESRMTFVECSTKAGWLVLIVLRKQDDFRLELYESLSKSA